MPALLQTRYRLKQTRTEPLQVHQARCRINLSLTMTNIPKHQMLRNRINFFRSYTEQDGGARRSRTDGLLNANQALSQLSYGPDPVCLEPAPIRSQASMVGRGRVELPTSRLSGVRSNHLSYRPEPGRPKPPQPSRRQATLGARGARNETWPQVTRSTNEGRETETARRPLLFCLSEERLCLRAAEFRVSKTI